MVPIPSHKPQLEDDSHAGKEQDPARDGDPRSSAFNLLWRNTGAFSGQQAVVTQFIKQLLIVARQGIREQKRTMEPGGN